MVGRRSQRRRVRNESNVQRRLRPVQVLSHCARVPRRTVRRNRQPVRLARYGLLCRRDDRSGSPAGTGRRTDRRPRPETYAGRSPDSSFPRPVEILAVKMMRILVIEDNVSIAQAVQTMLEAQKFAANVVGDGETGLDHLLRQSYDAAIVDVGLPGMDGFNVARKARAEGIQTPILMLTARDAVEDRVAGLDCGADDYLVKPFVEEELIARLRAILRRGDRPLVNAIEVGKLRVDVGARTASFDSKTLDLGATEFRLLELLARNAGIALSRTQVLERIWDYDFEGSSNIVDVYVSQLRRKLKKLGANGIIETVWGVGYRLTT